MINLPHIIQIRTGGAGAGAGVPKGTVMMGLPGPIPEG
jgi:hypothetical protein